MQQQTMDHITVKHTANVALRSPAEMFRAAVNVYMAFQMTIKKKTDQKKKRQNPKWM